MTALRALRFLPLLALTVTPSACKDDSFAVLSVVTYADTLDGVAQFRVHVGNGADVDRLFYPRQPTESLTLSTDRPVTFSVQFSSSRKGTTAFEVEPLDVEGNVLGYGKADASIVTEDVFEVMVRVVPGALRPEHERDGGIGDSDAAVTACDPYDPTTTCGAGRTCGLLCAAGEPAIGMCYAGGAGQPGSACATNSDCSPGSQCFTFSATGCMVTTCLRFCTDDSTCGEGGAYCNVPIPCGSSTPYRACSRPCDPTGLGTAGCATGLACFIYSDETTDCACPGQGTLGAPCSQNQGCNGELGCAGCAAGLSCVVPTGSTAGICRPVCKLAAPACPTGTACHSFAGSTRLVYGFCE